MTTPAPHELRYGPPPPPPPPAQRTHPLAAAAAPVLALVAAAAGGTGAGAATYAVASAGSASSDGWAELGWAVLALAVGALVAVVVLAIGMVVAARRVLPRGSRAVPVIACLLGIPAATAAAAALAPLSPGPLGTGSPLALPAAVLLALPALAVGPSLFARHRSSPRPRRAVALALAGTAAAGLALAGAAAVQDRMAQERLVESLPLVLYRGSDGAPTVEPPFPGVLGSSTGPVGVSRAYGLVQEGAMADLHASGTTSTLTVTMLAEGPGCPSGTTPTGYACEAVDAADGGVEVRRYVRPGTTEDVWVRSLPDGSAVAVQVVGLDAPGGREVLEALVPVDRATFEARAGELVVW